MSLATDELKQHSTWVGWNLVQRPKKDGTLANVKLPIDPMTGKAASSNKPETWSDVNTAWKAKNQFRLQGIGFVFTLAAGIVGIDLDNCFENGRLLSWADQVVECLDSYAEYSPSGNGLHIFTRGTLQSNINRSRDIREVEMYSELRYFCMTGKQFNGVNHINGNQTALDALYAVFSTEKATKTYKSHITAVDADFNDISEAIMCIPRQQDYYDWLRVLMAVHNAFPNSQGIGLCEQWSPGYKNEVASKFRSFDGAYSGEPVTIGTLFHMAKEHGWQGSSHKKGDFVGAAKLYRANQGLTNGAV